MGLAIAVVLIATSATPVTSCATQHSGACHSGGVNSTSATPVTSCATQHMGLAIAVVLIATSATPVTSCATQHSGACHSGGVNRYISDASNKLCDTAQWGLP